MAVSFEQFANEIRAFDNRREIVNEVRKDFRQGIPPLRKKVRANAIAMLPARGGLGTRVAKAAFSVVFKDRGRSVGLKVKVSQKSGKGKAELDRLDRAGAVRHPLYGNRKHWYSQVVAALFFQTAWDQAEWVERADKAMDRALDKLRRG